MNTVKMVASKRITKINRKTNAKLFCNAQVGDVLTFETEIKDLSGASSGGIYSPYVLVTNTRTNECKEYSFNQLVNKYLIILDFTDV